MTINPTLFKAILSMDAYNRGYNVAIDLRPRDAFGNVVLDPSNNNQPIASDKIGLQIGTATIKATRGEADAIAIGFYGISYDIAGGDNVISYRGTDQLVYWDGIGGDIWNGYGPAVGSPEGNQAAMAFAFYNSVATSLNGNTPLDPRNANISLTGHSLGGGLAGLVAAVYHQEGTLFANMGFEAAATATHYESTPHFVANLGVVHNEYLKQQVYGNYNGGTPWGVSTPSNLHTYSMDGEFLGYLQRVFQQTPETEFSIGPNVDLPGLDADRLHSQATLVIRMFADYGGVNGTALPTSWNAAAQYFWPLMYDDTFASQIGIDYQGTNSDADNLRTIIAYSAIEQSATSESVFGDTAIRAFYDDANDLGAAINVSWVNEYIETYAEEISKVLINYAGLLALHKVEKTDWATPYVAVDGVLSLSPYTNGRLLTLNFDNALWAQAGGNAIGGALPNTIGQAANDNATILRRMAA